MRTIGLVFVAFLLVAAPRAGAAQDTLATAKSLYQSAAYDEALGLLDRLTSRPPSAPDAQTIAQYRAYCLLALSRHADAEAAIEEVVKADLFFMPSDKDVSPRVRTAFQSVRHRLHPVAARSEYAIAKATFDRKEYAEAADQFGRLNALLQDPQLDGVAGIPDLRVLGAGFRDLASAAATPAPRAEAPPPPAPAPLPAPPAPKIYDLNEPGITPPATERQDVPAYPGAIRQTAVNRRASVDLVIDETGRVEKVTLRQRIDARYDALLVAAATTWRYTPAMTSDGRPVKFLKRLQITIQ